MKTRTVISSLAFVLLAQVRLHAQTVPIAIDAPANLAGNQPRSDMTVGDDFWVMSPITITQLGVFDDLGDGLRGPGVLTVQLYSLSGNSGTLLESLTFDAASPGTLVGAHRFKPLASPLTLLPGPYCIMAGGFDQTNRFVDFWLPPYNPATRLPWQLNDGGGLVRFGGGRYRRPPMESSVVGRKARANYVAGTFVYSAASLTPPDYAADYAALTSGVQTFPTPFRLYNHLGTIALFNRLSFPVVAEPSGNRAVVEAAGICNDDFDCARAVVFGNDQFGRSPDDARADLFDNAVRWASRKNDRSQIVVGVGPLLETNYLAARGYQLRLLPAEMTDTNSLAGCDVVAVNWGAGFNATAVATLAAFTAQGKGLIMTMTPWPYVHSGELDYFNQANTLLAPFGLAYRPTLAHVTDYGLTNISRVPYPTYFSAYPAATKLGQDHLGQIHLSSLEKSIALNTINYAIIARPDLMSELTALCNGGSTNRAVIDATTTNFIDVVTLTGAQAATNRLGRWQVNGDALVALGRRGAVEYAFTVPAGDMYRLQVVGTQNQAGSSQNNFDLILAVDGVPLGHHHLVGGYGTMGTAESLTPYLPAGPHTLRVFWDNAISASSLRIESIHVQSGIGPDDDGNGIKDWVDQIVRAQSGLDITNNTITSFVSPVCLEGRDAYPALLRLNLDSGQDSVSSVTARPEPDGRWFANVPLSAALNSPSTFSVSYQNGAMTEWRQLGWKPLNLLTTTNTHWTLRQGDSLMLTAQGRGTGTFTLTVGTNVVPVANNSPKPYRFGVAGTYTVTGVWTPTSGAAQSRSITVNVTGYQFPNNPDAWALYERFWALTNLPAAVVLQADPRLIFENMAALPDGRLIGLMIDRNEPRVVLARLGADGPVLDSARVNGFDFHSGGETYLRVVQTYADGSQLVEMLMVLSPALPDLTVRLDVIVGGVTFEDGSLSKTLTVSDFDSLGQGTVRFIRPASARTSVCHSVQLFQGAAFVGELR